MEFATTKVKGVKAKQKADVSPAALPITVNNYYQELIFNYWGVNLNYARSHHQIFILNKNLPKM